MTDREVIIDIAHTLGDVVAPLALTLEGIQRRGGVVRDDHRERLQVLLARLVEAQNLVTLHLRESL